MNDDPDARTSLDPVPKPASESTPPPMEPMEDTTATAETPVPGPSSTTVPTPTSTSPNSMPKRSKKMVYGIIAAAAVVVIGAGSALGYTMWYQNPDKVVHDAILNAIKAKARTTTGNITYKGEGFSLDIGLGMKSDNTQGEFSVNAKVIIDTDQTKQTFSADGIGRYVDDTIYVKVKGLTDVVEKTGEMSNGKIPSYAATIFEKIEDRWISIKPSDYEDFSEEISKQQTCYSNLSKEFMTNKQMSDEVMKLYRNNQIIIIKGELGSKNVNGVGSLGYKVDFDKNAAKSFASGLKDTGLGKKIKECDEDMDFDKLADNISTEANDSEKAPTIELWVSRFGHEVTEASVEADMKSNESFSLLLQPTFNGEVVVETPSGATSFKMVLEEIQQAMIEYYSEMFTAGGTLPEGIDSGIDVPLQSAI